MANFVSRYLGLGIDYGELVSFFVPKDKTYIVRVEMTHYDDSPDDEVNGSYIVKVEQIGERRTSLDRKHAAFQAEAAAMGRSTKNEKKLEQEKAVFDMFARDFELPEGMTVHGDMPDVVINGPRKIGIEITDLYHADGDNPSSQQVQQRYRDVVVQQAQALHREAGGRSIEVHFAFNFDNPIRKAEPLAKSIAELGWSIERGPSGAIPDYVFEHIPELEWVYWSGREYPDAKWRVTRSYAVPSLTLPRIEKTIAEKTERAKKYLACDAYWLLMVVNFWNPASDQDISWPKGATVRAGAFERIFLYRTHFASIEVPTWR